MGNPEGGPSHPGMTSKAATNPLAEGPQGVAQMREMAECNIPEESKKLNGQLAEFLKLEGDHAIAEKALGKGLFAGLRMNVHCKANLNTRTVVRFEGDNRLSEIAKELKEAETKALDLQKQLQAMAEKAQKLLAERWDYSVKTFGLNPDRNFYRINEANGIIEEVELRCDQCTAGKDMVDARLEVEEYMVKLNKEKANDGPTETGSTDES